MLDTQDKRQLDRIERGLVEVLARHLCNESGTTWRRVGDEKRAEFRRQAAEAMTAEPMQ